MSYPKCAPIEYILDIDSTFRDRVTFPLPSDFVIPVSDAQKGAQTSTNAIGTTTVTTTVVSDQIPTYSVWGSVGSTDPNKAVIAQLFRLDICGNTSQEIDSVLVTDLSGFTQELSGNYFVTQDTDSRLGTNLLITSADPTVISSLSGNSITIAPLPQGTVGQNRHLLRKQQPFYTPTVMGPGTVATDVSGNQYINFSALSGMSPSTVNGSYLHVHDGSSAGSGSNTSYLFTIKYLDTKQQANSPRLYISTNTDFSQAKWANFWFEICTVSTTSTTTSTNPGIVVNVPQAKLGNSTIYAVELLWLTLPNLNVINGNKGYALSYYPYFYVVLCNSDSRTASGNLLMSNNINSAGAVFKIPMVESTVEPSTRPFVRLLGEKYMQYINIRLDRPLLFRVVLSNGFPVQFQGSDPLPPYPSNPNMQITASFSFKRYE